MPTPAAGRALVALVVGLAGASPPASAHSGSNEMTLGSTRTRTAGSTGTEATNTQTSPPKGYLSNSFFLTIDFSEAWTLDINYILSATLGSALTHVFAAGVNFAPNDNWLFIASVKLSPATESAVAIGSRDYVNPLTGRTTTLSWTLFESLWSVVPGLVVAYESAGDGDFEWGVDLSASITVYTLSYRLVLDPPLTRIDPRGGGIQQYRVGPGFTAHLWDRLDLGVRGSYYVFVLPAGVDANLLQRTLEQATGGFPLAPLAWDLGLSATWFFTRKIYLGVNGNYGPYADACNGRTTMLTLKFTDKPGSWRLWASVSLQFDTPFPDKQTQSRCIAEDVGVDPSASPTLDTTTSSYVSVGAELNF